MGRMSDGSAEAANSSLKSHLVSALSLDELFITVVQKQVLHEDELQQKIAQWI